MRFWCQLGSIFDPKINENLFKNRSWDGSILWSIWGWIFYRFGVDFEGQLGAMLASKIDQKPPQTQRKTRFGARRRPKGSQIAKMIPKWPSRPSIWPSRPSSLVRFGELTSMHFLCFEGVLSHMFTSHLSPHQPGTVRLCVSISDSRLVWTRVH